MSFPVFKKLIKRLFGHQLARFYLARKLFNLLLWFFKIFNVRGEVDGNKISLGSKIGLELFVNVSQKPFQTEIFKQQIKKGDIVIDLGANIGYYTLIAAKIVGEDGKVFAFEPDADNFSMLERNIKLNDYKNIIPVKKAVSNRTGKTKLYLNERDPSMHTLGEKESQKSVEIEVVSLDDFFKDGGKKVDFIKMDIEGSEGWAFKGMSSILEKNHNLRIITEFNPLLLKNNGFGPEDYLSSLVKFGFGLNYINESEKKLESVTVREIIYEHPEKQYTNLLCLR